MTTRIQTAPSDSADWLQTSFNAHMGWTKPAGYFAKICARQAAGHAVLLVALQSERYLGHCIVNWTADYPPFRASRIPEIQDLNVRPDCRRRGIASRLLDEAEQRIATRSKRAGIGFGLYADYGASQRLLIQRGYIPDGRGAHYANQPAMPGKHYPLDDQLVLYLCKQL